MSSPIELIRLGIIESNWTKIEQAYTALTGDSIDILPENMVNNRIEIDGPEDALREIVNIATKILDTIPLPKQQKKKTTKKKIAKKKKAKQNKDESEDEEDETLILDKPTNTATTENTDGVRLVTNHANDKEVERNKTLAKRAQTNKEMIDRTSDAIYIAQCNECQKDFKSKRPGSKNIGQKCPECLSARRDRFHVK